MSTVIAFPDDDERHTIQFAKEWTALLAEELDDISEAQAAAIVQLIQRNKRAIRGALGS